MLRPAAFCSLHLLYLDDSGAVQNPSDRRIVLAGLSVFERSPHWLSGKLDVIAERVWPDNPAGLEFRGTDIIGGKKHWRGVRREERERAYMEALSILADYKGVRLFGAVVHKASVSPQEPMAVAFEHIASRFDRMLGRLYKGGDTQRGLIVLDRSTYETSLQGLATTFRTEGHKWGQLHNLSEVPLFVDSRATRMVQYADLIAHALRRYHEQGNSTYFDVIKRSFDASGGVLHGLIHDIGASERCACFSCFQRVR